LDPKETECEGVNWIHLDQDRNYCRFLWPAELFKDSISRSLKLTQILQM